MKIEKLELPVVLEPTVVSIELTQDEAEIITLLLGKTTGTISNLNIHDIVLDMYEKLNELFPDYNTRFSYDIEEGSPHVERR